ncbi:MAG: hypothetical protein DMF57_01360 [Acidobacteria bacterium]|nr:MAG: hypothetical protein DMF57_01360 [Acidobacteriota bacterium]
MIGPQRADISLHVAARQRHLYDQMVQHDVVQHDHAGVGHRLAIDELVMRIVAQLIDSQVGRRRSQVGLADSFNVDLLAKRGDEHRGVMRHAGFCRRQRREHHHLFHAAVPLARCVR